MEEEVDAVICFPRWKTVLPLVLDLVWPRFPAWCSSTPAPRRRTWTSTRSWSRPSSGETDCCFEFVLLLENILLKTTCVQKSFSFHLNQRYFVVQINFILSLYLPTLDCLVQYDAFKDLDSILVEEADVAHDYHDEEPLSQRGLQVATAHGGCWGDPRSSLVGDRQRRSFCREGEAKRKRTQQTKRQFEKSKQFICSRETKLIVLTKLQKVPDVAEQSRPPTQVEAPAPWSNMIVTMFRKKMMMIMIDHCIMNMGMIKGVHLDEDKSNGE